MKVLLSIKPKYVDEIIKGNKKYEFRKTDFKRKKELKEVYIYSTSPVKKIVGYFEFEKIIKDHPNVLWENYKEFSGIDEEEFFQYYEGRNNGFAIEIGRLELFEEPIDPKTAFPNFTAPQSFRYFEEMSSEQISIEQFNIVSSK